MHRPGGLERCLTKPKTMRHATAVLQTYLHLFYSLRRGEVLKLLPFSLR